MSNSVHRAQYVTVWEFQVRPGFEQQFERTYGPQGGWAELFRKGKGYIRTELYRDVKNRRRYLTVDIWESELAYRKFRDEHADEYAVLDQRCEDMTEKEAPLGTYENLTTDSEPET